MLRTWIACAACGFSLAAANAGAQTAKRLYVEPFTTKAQREKLRDEVVTELRKVHSVAVVGSDATADLILGGGGEIWVKGYRSLNPRSGQSTANGTPVYGGYLSVELRDTKGETLWSDLVTPGPGSEDVAKDLSKKIAKDIAEALPHLAPAASSLAGSRTKLTLHGAGASFPAPVYAKWFTNYRRENPGVEITYDSVGSESGIRRLIKGEVDFGASDSPEAVREIEPGAESRFLFFPSVAGAVVPVVNLPGVADSISFTPGILAGIYMGTIKKWTDPQIRQANRGVHLPDLDIVVVHRSDGSGTSYAWTEFLSQTSGEWKSKVGSAMAPKWPTGREANGNDGVAKLVKELGGAIGYVEYIYALQNHIDTGRVRNRNGEFVAASLESINAAAKGRAKISDDLKVSIVNAPGAGAYPISTFTWLAVPVRIPDEAKRAALSAFLKWMLGPGQKQAAALGYLALPKDLVMRELAALERLQ